MSSIRKSLTTGVFYTALAKYSGVFFSIVIGAVLARLLTPEEFGIVALVTVFATFFRLLSDFGIGQAVVQNQKLTKQDIQSIFSFSVIFGIVLSVVFYLAAPFIANFYKERALINVTKLLSLSVLFASVQIIPKAISQKNLKFKQIGIVTVIIQVVCGITAIILAYNGFSYYALVYQSIISSALTLIVFYLLNPIKVVFKIRMEAVKKIIRFSTFNFLFNFINYFSRNGDNLLIGKFLGSTALGFYDKAYRLMMLPAQNLTHVVTPVLMPVLAKHQDDKELIYNTYSKVVKILATIGFPLSVLLFFSAHEIINLLYGPQWELSIPVFKIIALTIGIQMIYSSAGSIFQAVDRTDLLFIYGVIGAILLLSGISYGVFIGKSIEAVGYGILIAFILNFFIVFYMLIHLALRNSYFTFLKNFIYPLIISLVLAFTLQLYSYMENQNFIISFLFKISISLFVFGGLFMMKEENQMIIKSGFNKLKINRNNKK
ncbi:MAG: lipopolysaccharide biosynthesis protein [Draconibacterium sp.]